jgi:HTH-type transcriptional regulator/antitoxin HigA
MTSQIANLQAHWPPIAPVFSIRNEHEYDAAVARLNALLDEIGTNEKHPLYGLLDTLGTLIHSYESDNHVIPDVRGPDVLQSLMEEHGVSATNLPEIGSEDVVRRYLAGQEELNIEQVRALARRFHVSPSAFI